MLWPPFLHSTPQHGWHVTCALIGMRASHLRLHGQPLKCEQELVDDRVGASIHKVRVRPAITSVAAT